MTATLTVLPGWNIWDVSQADAPLEPLPGSQNDRLATWVRLASGLGDALQVALVSSSAAGAAMADRADFPETQGKLTLGVNGSAITLRKIAFENQGARKVVPWPHDDDFIVERAYLPASAPSSDPDAPVEFPNTTAPAPATPDTTPATPGPVRGVPSSPSSSPVAQTQRTSGDGVILGSLVLGTAAICLMWGRR